jgi:hypothetical protein
MTTLYSLALDGIEIEQLLFDSVGEITPDIQVKLDAVLESGPPMMEAAAAVVRQLQISAQIAEDESKRLHARAKEFEAQSDRLKERMTFALDKSFGGKIKTPKWSIWTQKSADRILADLVPGITPEMLYEERPDLVRVKMEFDRVKAIGELKAGRPLPEMILFEEKEGERGVRIK